MIDWDSSQSLNSDSITTVNNMAASQISDVSSDTGPTPKEEQETLDLVQQLLRSFQNGQSGMVFACGGKVPIPVENDMAQQSSAVVNTPTPYPPVTLRWDPSSKTVPAVDCKLQFPLDHSDDATVHNLQQLLDDMQPATFGFQGQDVLDESYRKASKLDPARFACTFNPHELGIIDDVSRILLPGFLDQAESKNKAFCEPRLERTGAIRAELYKLNIYAGPSGRFKAHVDTPRSAEQIGSLVVCLPSIHEGGQLEVRHEGQTVNFDWGMPETARPEIQWAAFYSDCEHEVLEVTSGHRITLTYNLYATSSTGTTQAGHGLVDPTQLPWYGNLESLFLQEDFMPDGGYLGVHTSHAYPHASSAACLPATLKGADMVAWETFRSLGCAVRVRPVVELPAYAHYGHEDLEPCPAEDLTDTSSESFDKSSESFDKSADGYDEHSQVEEFEESSSQAGQEAGAPDGAPAPEAADDDQPMAEAPEASESWPESWTIDDDEVEALQREQKEYQSLPKTEFQGIEPSGLLIPVRDLDPDQKTISEFSEIGEPCRCQTLGNGMLFYRDPGLIEGDVEMGQMLDRWIAKQPRGAGGAPAQTDRVLFEEVAWLNRFGRHKEPQISYTAVSCPQYDLSLLGWPFADFVSASTV